MHTTAKSHHRILIVEVMGRYAGWMTLESGIGGGASVILIPEVEVDIEDIITIIKNREKKEKYYAIIAVSEGAKLKGLELYKDSKEDAFGPD